MLPLTTATLDLGLQGNAPRPYPTGIVHDDVRLHPTA
jgi:hypothetical protein